jgi:EAL domain-containing protein (putative c-di-GMP-specific phosphodiesterase class I)
MKGLAGSLELQQRVSEIVEAADKRGVQTVAERVDDADTMGLIWQPGVQYIQSYDVRALEEVILSAVSSERCRSLTPGCCTRFGLIVGVRSPTEQADIARALKQ